MAGSAVSFGALMISLVGVSKNYVAVGATSMPFKMNFDTYDASLGVTGDGLLAGKNQVYSYWSSVSTYSDFNSDTIVKNYLFGGTASKSSAAGVWPKSQTGTQSVLLQINFDITGTGLCDSTPTLVATNYWGTSTAFDASCNTGTSTYLPQIAVLLKVVFNNNVLGLTDSITVQKNGVKVLASLFSGASSTTDYTDYPSSGTGAGVANFLTKETQFWHVSVLCKTATAAASAVTSCFASLL
jgi:hypothetical protein